jgi:hypothetical protein
MASQLMNDTTLVSFCLESSWANRLLAQLGVWACEAAVQAYDPSLHALTWW